VIFSVEQVALQEAIREFCSRECGTREQRNALTDGGEYQHNQAIYEQLADLGYLGISIPEEYGGVGGGLVDHMILFEELARGLAPVHGIGPTHTVAGIYKRYGQADQKKAALGAICAGEVMSISISEPEAGSDAAAIRCRAVAVNDGYVINGQKTWCSAAQEATEILLVARTDRGARPQDGLTMFAVPRASEGLLVKPIKTMGGSEVNDLYFTDVWVPKSAVVGEPGAAWPQLMEGLNGERLVCSAQSLGSAQRVFDDVISYVRDRKQFGKAIGTFQAIRHRISDLAIELEAARALLYSTMVAIEAGTRSKTELVRLASMCKAKTTETLKRTALEGVQMMGGYGYSSEFDMERHLRLAIPSTIFGGTSEIQREIIAGTYALG
jgi:butyryl-CoA dehydrogenase